MSTQSSPPRPGGTAAPAGGRRVLPVRPRRDRPPPDPEAHMALVGHLRELRDRLIRVVIVLIATTTLAFFFVDRLVHFFLNLLPEGPNIHVQVLQPAETFT